MVEDVRVAHGILGVWRRWSISLLLGMDGGDVCCWITMSLSGLLAMSDEVLEVLYGRHGELLTPRCSRGGLVMRWPKRAAL